MACLLSGVPGESIEDVSKFPNDEKGFIHHSIVGLLF